MYKCKYFKIQELVPENAYAERGEKAWELLDERALITLDTLHDKYGTMIINNWLWGGPRQWSGLRTASSPYGTMYSQHRFGRAFDVIFKNYDADHVRQEVLNNPEWFPLITSLELDVSWFHFDVRNCERIKVYKP